MKINYGPKGMLMIDNSRIVFRNFAGAGTQFNREGDRNFAVVITDSDIADELSNDNWNVKVKPPRNPDDDPFMYLPVKIKFNDRGPSIYLEANGQIRKLNEETCRILDNIDIADVSMDIRPYDWELSSGKSGRTAYLQSIKVVQAVDRFAPSRFETEENW